MERNQYFNRDFYRLWTSDHVRFSDLDPVGHVNNNSISQYFENARAYLYMKMTPGWPNGGHVFVLAHTAMDYCRELHMPAELEIGTAIQSIGRTSLTVTNALFHGKLGIAGCTSVSVLIDGKTRRPIEIPDDLRFRCQELMI